MRIIRGQIADDSSLTGWIANVTFGTHESDSALDRRQHMRRLLDPIDSTVSSEARI